MFSSKAAELEERKRALGKKFFAPADAGNIFRQAARDAGDGAVVLSSEGIYKTLTEEDLERFKAFADELFDETLIVAYIRAPMSFTTSSVQKQIRAAHRWKLKLDFPSYREGFEKFDRVFGRERVKLWPFDRSIFPDGNVVKHFCSELGFAAPPPARPVNSTLSRPAVSAFFRMNHLIRDHDLPERERALKAHKLSINAVAEHFPHQDWPGFRLAPALFAQLLERNREDISWMEERLGCSLTETYPDHADDIGSAQDLLTIDPAATQQLRELSKSLPSFAGEYLCKALDMDRPVETTG